MGNQEIVRSIKSIAEKEDEVSVIKTTSTTIEKKLNDEIKNADMNFSVLILNPRDPYVFKKDFLDRFRKEGVVTSNLRVDSGVPSLKSSLKFDRNNFIEINRGCKNVVEYIKILRELLYNYIYENDIVFQSSQSQSDDVIEISSENSKTEKVEKKEEKEKERSQEQKQKQKDHKKPKPRILAICDVEGWAWWIKAEYLRKMLEDFYQIDIIHVIGKNKQKVKDGYDLYLTFGHTFVSYTKKMSFKKRITGITAHRSKKILEPKMQLAYATHANSILLFKELKSIHNNSFYTPNGVDTILFREIRPVMDRRDIPIIGHVGKKGKMKNQSTIIEPVVKKSNIKYSPHYNDYRNKINHSDMVNVHQQYDIFIAASDEDGTPNGMLEAAACGRPIVINNIGNAPEFITNGYNGFVVNKKIDDYVDVVKWFKENPEKVIEMGKNARKEVEEKWTWDLMSRNYLYLFDNILNTKRDKEEYENPALYHSA